MRSPHFFVSLVLAIALLLSSFISDAIAQPPEDLKTRHVILVTIDGVRIQEAFGGLDSVIAEAPKELSGIANTGDLKAEFMRPTAEERRRALMPFFWEHIARDGIVLGDPSINSSVAVTNRFKVSYPGYAEILTGADQPKVASNLPFRMPRGTVFEFLMDKKGWKFHEIAAFASWQTFNLITQREKGTFFTNAGYAAMPAEWKTPGMEPLNSLQFQMLTPWDTARFDRITTGLAIEYLRAHRPRLLYLALDEPDDWGHSRRYDRVLQSIREADRSVREIWEVAQSMEVYRDVTTLIVTTDHGRGLTPEDWIDHDRDTPGSEATWIAVMGPDTPALGRAGADTDFMAGQVAATVARFFGEDYGAFYPEAAPPLTPAFSAR